MSNAHRPGGAGVASGLLDRGFWLRELPYLLLLIMTVGGVAYGAMTHKLLVVYWELTALAGCGVGIFSGWSKAAGRDQRLRLIWTQALHWGAFLAAMNLVFLPSVQAVADADATSLTVLLLLALGTFVAGVHTASWRMALNGIVMGLCVPAAAWLDQSALFVALVMMIVAAVAGLLLWARFRR
ncbi:hypothetical protein [Enterovirga sp.]|uniref:hypothetical protein n=1 Tax=Enterovirga sp. TaxID=2026350 RepID=UPI002BCE1B00|nr:hypothetical protein [Enterovirga sp.]HMO28630.1 hypothetical protein [Enterovirga sp.]